MMARGVSMTTVTLEFLAAQMDRLLGAVAVVEARSARVDARLDELATRLGTVETRLEKLETRLERLEGRFGAVETRLERLEEEQRSLRTSHEALDQRVREMTADGKLTLAFLARQAERILDEQGRLRDDVTVLTGMVMRLEGTVQGLTVEVRGEPSRYERLAREVARLREPAPS
jgi:chromosome segregation ATPase